MADETVLNLFVSSPGDVQAERERVDLVVERLNAEFAGRVRIRTIRWETRYYSSHETFQTQIPEASACDLVVAIFGARLGSPLPAQFPPMPSGEPYPSGSAYEVLSAMEARRRGQGVPDVYVFRRPDSPVVALDASNRGDIETQWRRLTDFFEKWFRSRAGEFLAAFQEFETTDEFAVKVEDCLRQWLARRGFVAKGAIWDRARLGPPFPGLAAFDEERQTVFFGRSLFVDQAIRRLRELEAPASEASRASFLMLIGASGSGKSSLLRAGLAPRIVLPGAFPEVDLWRRAIISADADPFAALAAALLKPDALGPELGDGPFGAAGLLAKQLAGDPDAAVAPLKDALARAAAKRARQASFETPRPARLFLGLDQAERLISETPPELAARFATLIARLARLRLATIVVVLRSDAYAGFQALAPLVALRDAGASLDLLPPNASELEDMTTGPVALCEPPLAFERRDGRSLAATLIADAHGGDALPLLQMTLSRLAAAEAARRDGVLRFSDYRGMGAAVTETADEALAGLEPAARAQLPNLIAGLVRDVAADPVTGAPTPVIGVLDVATFEASHPERRALVEAFVAKRLLTAEGDASSQRVRPTHEALLRIWPEATTTIAEAAQLLRVRHALAPLARDWAEAAESDKPRHLDIAPALLDGAQRYVERFADEVPPATRAFVTAASAAAAARRDRELEEQRRRAVDAEAIAAGQKRIAQRTGVGLAAALMLAALAGWQWYSAELARKDAQTQRDRAERTLAAATKTADTLVFDLAQKFRNVAGVPKSVVKDILDRARGLQEQLLTSGESSAKLTANHAAALGELSTTELSLGDLPTALALARQARDIYEAILAGAPNDERYIHDIAFTDESIGDILSQQGDYAAAQVAYESARARTDAALLKSPESQRLRTDKALYLEDLGSLARTRGNSAGALKWFRDGLTAAQSIADAAPKEMAARHGLAVAHRNVGDALLDLREADSAQVEFDAASAIAKSLAQEFPQNTLLQRDYTLSQERLGETLTAKKDLAGALKAFSEGEATAIALAAGDQSNLEWQYDIAIGHVEVGDAQQAMGDFAGALESFGAAVAIDRLIVERDMSNALWRKHLYLSLGRLGDALYRHDEGSASLDAYRDMLAAAEAGVARAPGDAEWARRVAESEGKVADALVATNDVNGALTLYRSAVAHARALPESRDARAIIVSNLTRIAGQLALANDVAGSIAAYGEAETRVRAFVAEDPKAILPRGDLAMLLVSESHMRRQAGNADLAIAELREAAQISTILAAEEPSQTLWARERLVADDRLGDTLRGADDSDAAIAAYRDGLSAFATLPSAAAADPDVATTAAYAEESVSAVEEKRKAYSDALAAMRKARTLRSALADTAPGDSAKRRAELVDVNAVGRLENAAGDAKASLATLREGLAIARALAARSDADATARNDLAISLTLIGTTLTPAGQPAQAAAAYEEALLIVEALAKAEPANASYAREVWLVSVNLGDARVATQDFPAALAAYVQARDVAAAALARDGKDATAAGERESSVVKIGLLANAMLIARDFSGALGALDQATPATPEQNWLDLVRAASLMFLGRADEARRLYDKHRGEKTYGGKTWEAAATEGFANLRAKGLADPLMDEIEASFAAPN